ncbi:phage Gp37/Gp68 family protein [Bradyrhizobium sp. I71]|uniref:DUF5131 family protein n=1 Tax=Bradyrhizobium sp. I71 TaxID=2590772 RepID=UPI001EF92CD9|nr:phage Gp37/Gp68 family protein [Bradyrhizobium sp. I71]ULK98877.1 phage Gp37/Gp68 family protein [Bradyrhizobium sp. I71]
MADRSKIEWTDASWNPIRARNLKTGKVGWHCEHATTGCEHCYSEGFNKRFGTGLPFKPGHRKDIEIFLDEQMLTQPLRWKKPRKIFVCSMTDAFADFVTDQMLDKMFAVMALAPQHTFQVLTKRAGRMKKYFDRYDGGRDHNCADFVADAVAVLLGKPGARGADRYNGKSPAWPLPNVWLGVSAERQQEANERIPELLATPAAVRFVSIEPMLDRISLHAINLGTREPLDALRGVQCVPDDSADGDHNKPIAKLDMVIVGGESGAKARPVHPLWVRDFRDWCKTTDVAFFFKQWGEFLPWSQFNGAAIEDHPEQTRFRTMEWEDGRWNDVGFPMWCDTVDGNIDDEQCVGRVGKAKAGRLLDGVEHSAFPKVPA